MTDPSGRLRLALADRYRLERELGQGGMATVYLADDVKHGRKVAIKVLRPELAAVIGAERFLSEIRTTANLQHPHILPLFDSGQALREGGGVDTAFLFYVMPYVEGESLRDRLTREKQLPIPEAVRIASEVASALDYAHRRGIVHRDIKPENILLHEGRALVADFGIALAASKAGESRMTQTGMSLGTPSYMSPEQAMGERDIGPRSDIYALGAVTYEMLVGDPPFSGSTVQSIVAKVMTEKPIPPSRMRETVPAAVEHTVLTALQKLPADRFGSAAEFASALSDGEAAGRQGETSGRRDSGPARRRTAFTVAVGVAVVSLAAAVWALTSRPGASVDAQTIRFPLEYAPGVRVATPINNPLAISPDGSIVAFSGRTGDGPFQVFVRPLADLTERALPGTEGGEQPCFSTDGAWMAFMARHQLKKVALAGGVPSVVADIPGLVYGCSWTPDGRIVVSRGYRLEIVPAIGGTPSPLLPEDTTRGYLLLHPKVMPDGKTVIMTRWRGSGPTARLWRATIGEGVATDLGLAGGSVLGLLDGQLIYGAGGGTLMAVPFDMRTATVRGEPVPVFEGIGGSSLWAAQAALSATGSLVLQAGDAKGRLTLVDLDGRVRRVIPESQLLANPRFSPDGNRIAVGLDHQGRRDVSVYDLRSQTMSRVTAEGTTNDRPEWLDDSRLVFRSIRDGDMAYWSQSADGSPGATLVARVADREMWEGVPSLDGRSFVFRTGTVGSADVWVRGFGTDTIPRLLVASPFTEWAARPSPDGMWVAYESDESGEYEVYVRPLAEVGTRLRVSIDGGVEPIWSRDGKRLYYWRGEELMVATLATAPALAVTSRTMLFRGDPPTTTGHANYDVSPDGSQVVLIRPLLDSVRTVVVHRWDQELRARLAGTTQ